MSTDSRRHAAEPRIDIATVRETLAYISDDMSRSARLSRVRAAVETALAEIRAIEGDAIEPAADDVSRRVVAFPEKRRFVPWTPG